MSLDSLLTKYKLKVPFSIELSISKEKFIKHLRWITEHTDSDVQWEAAEWFYDKQKRFVGKVGSKNFRIRALGSSRAFRGLSSLIKGSYRENGNTLQVVGEVGLVDARAFWGMMAANLFVLPMIMFITDNPYIWLAIFVLFIGAFALTIWYYRKDAKMTKNEILRKFKEIEGRLGEAKH